MKAMILAAGRGQRLRPLTDTLPKPLISVHGKPLIEHLIQALHTAGIQDIIINHAHLGHKIEASLGDGQRYNVRIHYSPESPPGLETGGGIRQAIPLLGDEPFIVVNGDIWTHFPFENLPQNPEQQAHLVMVNNPAHNREGDFALHNHFLNIQGKNKLTFSGIGVYKRSLFDCFTNNCTQKKRFSLRDILIPAMQAGKITGEHYTGEWMDIGSHERLSALREKF